jgi:hypothetical protein
MDIYEECKTQTNRLAKLKVDYFLTELPKKDAESLRSALLDDVISSRTISRVLLENGIECGVWAINQWRRVNKVKSSNRSTHVKVTK